MGSNAPAPWAVIGTFVHAPVYGDLEIATERCLVISGEGTITAIAPASQAESVLAQHGVNPSSVLRLQVIELHRRCTIICRSEHMPRRPRQLAVMAS